MIILKHKVGDRLYIVRRTKRGLIKTSWIYGRGPTEYPGQFATKSFFDIVSNPPYFPVTVLIDREGRERSAQAEVLR